MAVVIETTLGDITVDLFLEQRPVTCLNFLKLCKMKYYNFNLFHSIRSGFIAQTGDPSGEGTGGQSIFGLLEGPLKQFFSGEKMPKIRHTNAGLLSMVCSGDMMVGSQFFFTLAPDLDSLDGVHCVIGEVTEGHEVLRKLNEVICDESHRPYQDVRITHTVVLEDPFNDPSGFRAPSRSPSPSADRLKGGRIAPDEEIDETQGKTAEEVQEMIEEKEAKARATILEIVGDLPDADIAPPENVLFVCKLNPVTTDEDLEIIFSRFGSIVNCEVIRDKKSGDSLQYAFIEFSDKKSCEDAYFKMDNVLIDDRRIHVDFSQSVSKMRWLGKGRGVKYFNDNGDDITNNHNHSRSNRSQSRDKNKPKISNHHNDIKRDKINQDRHDDRNKRHQSNRESRYHRERSPRRSKVNSRDNKDYSYKQNSKRDEKTNKNNHSNSHKARPQCSPVKDKSETRKSPLAKNKNKTDIHWAENDGKSRSRIKHIQSKKKCVVEESKSKDKRNRIEEYLDSSKNSKKFKKNDHQIEPRTPSPTRKIIEKVRDRKNIKKNKHIKKKRKPSTSTSSDSSDSSSSSSSTSSSEEDRKRKKNLKRHRKKYSSSSSSDSSDSSSSSSTSSDSSSETTSSSSDSEPSKRKKLKCSSKRSADKKSMKRK